jgi:hypothetical protein
MATEIDPTIAAARGRAGEWALRVLLAGGLAADAYTHADLARFYTGGGRAISQQAVFLAEAGAAVAAALLVLAVARRWVHATAFVIAASAFAAAATYRYVDVGALGPVPDMYEPLWYPEKVVSFVAEAIAVLAAVGLLLRLPTRSGAGTARKR